MAARRSERLIDLLLLLLHSRLPVPWSEIRKLPSYVPNGRDPASVQRQFERDKEDLRALGVPVEYVEPIEEEGEGGYILDRRRYFLPRLTFTEEEAVALALAEGIASRLAQALGEDAFAAWTKLACLPDLPRSIRGAAGNVARHIRVAPTPARPAAERAVLDHLRRAIEGNRTLRLTYRKYGTDEARERQVDPYGLLIRRGIPYLIAFDHLRKSVLMFRASRIAAVEVAHAGSGSDFTVPAQFSLDRWARREPWEFGSEPPATVTVRVAPRLASLVERSLGRRAIASREQGGAVILRLTVSDTGALLRWVLGLGRAAEIVEPAALRKSARELLAAARDAHAAAPERAVR